MTYVHLGARNANKHGMSTKGGQRGNTRGVNLRSGRNTGRKMEYTMIPVQISQTVLAASAALKAAQAKAREAVAAAKVARKNARAAAMAPGATLPVGTVIAHPVHGEGEITQVFYRVRFADGLRNLGADRAIPYEPVVVTEPVTEPASDELIG